MKNTFGQRLWINVKRDKVLLIIMVPVVAYFLIFAYWPMVGIVIAFQNFKPGNGFFGSQWVGMTNLRNFFSSYFFWRLLRNTLLLSVYGLIWGFPIPILFALALNEIKNKYFKRVVQSVSYLPYFISTVVVVGILYNMFSAQSGVVNGIITRFGGQTINFLGMQEYFRSLYIGSGVWQYFGYISIIYLAALAGLDMQLYEAAKIDGASRFKQIIHVAIPGITPTIIILLILSAGQIMNVGFEKIVLMSVPSTYEVSDVIQSYVYRVGIRGSQFSIGAAVGLFNSVANFIVLIAVNWISRRTSETSLW